MKVIAHSILSLLPGSLEAIRAVTNRARLQRKFGGLRTALRHSLYGDDEEIRVLSGPFKGMRYFDRNVWGIISNKWLGSYEAELHATLEEIIATDYEVILDVGCAEGWYVNGLAWRMPGARVCAYDTDPISRHQCSKLAELNHVRDRVEISSLCSYAEFEALADRRALIICDIEGAEVELLDPSHAPALCGTDILVEVHESGADAHDVADLLKNRFAGTHKIITIQQQNRSAWLERGSLKLDQQIAADLLAEAVDEHRAPGNGWLWMKTAKQCR